MTPCTKKSDSYESLFAPNNIYLFAAALAFFFLRRLYAAPCLFRCLAMVFQSYYVRLILSHLTRSRHYTALFTSSKAGNISNDAYTCTHISMSICYMRPCASVRFVLATERRVMSRKLTDEAVLELFSHCLYRRRDGDDQSNLPLAGSA